MTEGIIMPPTTFTVPTQRAPEHTEEWRLVAAAAAGDRDAFDQLYRANDAGFRRHITRKVPYGPLAQDIASMVWERAWSHRQAVTDQGRPYLAWLFTIANNVIYDHHKSAAARLSTPMDPHSFWKDEKLSSGYDFAAAGVLQHETARLVRAAVGRLTADQQRVLELRFFQDRNVAETAAEMGLTIGAVKALQYRATRALVRDDALRGLAVML